MVRWCFFCVDACRRDEDGGEAGEQRSAKHRVWLALGERFVLGAN